MRRRSGSCCRGTSTPAAGSSPSTAARSRSSSATRSWRSGARRPRPRTMPSARCVRRSTSSWPSPRSGRRSARKACGRAPACSPARRPSRLALRARAWSPAISSTRRRGSSPRPSPGASSSASPRAGRRSRQSCTRKRGRSSSKARRTRFPCGRRAGSSRASGGSLKSEGLEAPFVGRDRELQQIKDLFHSCAAEGRAHLVSVTGIAGIGKSRLAWEFYKYFDGIAETVYWHRGRCLPYGEGVTYWALADMVRMRCRIAEEEAPASALPRSSMRRWPSTFPTRMSAPSSSPGSRISSV